ncbi:DUF3253 domain-containing protein [Mycobacterium camsae]|uniref:DUF3253 domain-containing protein n=1 Tax=Mycobacterium gordonae TaxID=1778 RepID=UPI00197ED4E9|nr:DUF3253 domain-containing protein [Mycobacterium gordonae]
MAAKLRAELSRAVGAQRRGSHHAEIALGGGPLTQRLQAAILALSELRGPDSSTCPSDAARVIGGPKWRELLDEARAIARNLAKTGQVEITQRGNVLDPDSDWRGPVRIRTARR